MHFFDSNKNKLSPILIFGMILLQFVNFNCTSQHSMEHKYTNHLIDESSPYLLQHAHNPVDWHPWGEKALAKAKAENKLIIISIGYSACHWCHVMERESFEDSTAAAVMNEHFVSIKVDREERPDIDQIYMDAVMLMTGRGGWPLNCIALPDGRPIWGGTYFPKEQWMQSLQQLVDLYKNDPQSAEKYANQLTSGMQEVDQIIPNPNASPFEIEDLTSMIDPWKNKLDMVEGGPNKAPKFPMPNNYLFLLRTQHFTQDALLETSLELTLRKMAWGGIYDHAGGGFARYSTDKLWLVPHFEKMLYDNGQLVSLYSEAYLKDPKPLYKDIVYQTLEYTEREMTSDEGGFFSSLDADSEGEEGKFYVWKKSELTEILGSDADWYNEYYRISEAGNWEHGNNILHHTISQEDFAKSKEWSLEDFRKKLKSANEKVMKVREKRIRPGLDDKILASWNAIMLKGYVDAYRVFGEKKFLKAAVRNAEFLNEKLANGKGLFRNYKEGKASINAFLDDYALVAEAFLELYQVNGDDKWLLRSKELCDFTIEKFYDEEKQMFFYTSSDDAALISRKYETTDNVIPASNSVMANNLFVLSHIFDRPDFEEKSTQMLQNIRANMAKYPSGYSNWGILMLKHLYPFYEVVMCGKEAESFSKDFGSNHYFPNKLLISAEKESSSELSILENRFVEGATFIYVCQNKACKLPVETVEAALDLMK